MVQINQDNLHLLLPGKICWLVEYLREDYGFTLQESLNRIYHSKLYKKLSTASTLYWHLGPVDLYNELKTEIWDGGQIEMILAVYLKYLVRFWAK